MMNVERLSGHEEYEELSNEPAFSKMVKEWKAYRSTGLSPADIPALSARAEAAEAERDAIKDDGFCSSCTGCYAPHDPSKILWCKDWEWCGQEAGKENTDVRDK